MSHNPPMISKHAFFPLWIRECGSYKSHFFYLQKNSYQTHTIITVHLLSISSSAVFLFALGFLIISVQVMSHFIVTLLFTPVINALLVLRNSGLSRREHRNLCMKYYCAPSLFLKPCCEKILGNKGMDKPCWRPTGCSDKQKNGWLGLPVVLTHPHTHVHTHSKKTEKLV